MTNGYEKAPGDSNGYLYKDANGNAIVSLGKVVHETAHIFGLGDLYNPKSQSPVYFMSVISGATAYICEGTGSSWLVRR